MSEAPREHGIPASQLYTGRRVAPLLALGFASGLPLALTGGTLQAWATVEQVCPCGAWRLVNVNQGQKEVGHWQTDS